MTEVTIDAPATTPAIALPPSPRVPKVLQAFAFVASRRRTVEAMSRRHGEIFTIRVPVFGNMIAVADPQLAKQLFAANTDDVGNVQPNLSRILGSGSVFALDGTEHKRRRKLLTPPFHGKSIKNYEVIFEEETLRETASWPDGEEFESLEPMMRITLNAILRAVFGADGEQLDELRRIIPPWVTLGSKLAVLPAPSRTYGRLTPWGRLAAYRRQYDAVVERLIDTVTADPHFEERDDVLTLLLRSTYEDGKAMSRRDIGDELLTLLAAGHETTASTLAWVFERVSRHPQVLQQLVDEAGTDGDEYRQATILETQRARTVIDFAGRHVYAATFQLGDYVIPRGYSIFVAIDHIHGRAQDFPSPERFDPQRFLGKRPATAGFIPYGGGTRRCVGAAFANVEMDVVLRTVLRHFEIETTTAPDEKTHSRGVAYTPKAGGRLVVRRRATPLA
ncbi:cytochrome P450 [Mycobacterium sp. NPDC006124]|uniref:cytochrome P450 n=1 Tax=Mycobacterium sp. NPDC006124 TaxID=3156729 RepID=UPI0033A74005